MKSLLLSLTLLVSTVALAHDEGHGPKLGDQPKYGGKVAAVISKSEVNKGTKAEMRYKAELTKTNDGTIRVYLYDKKMNLLPLQEFASATGELLFKDRKTKKWTAHEFKFSKKDKSFEGKLPTQPRRPFNIDVTLKKGDKDLFIAFDNLN